MARNYEIRVRVSRETKTRWNLLVSEIMRRHAEEIDTMEDVVKKIIDYANHGLREKLGVALS